MAKIETNHTVVLLGMDRRDLAVLGQAARILLAIRDELLTLWKTSYQGLRHLGDANPDVLSLFGPALDELLDILCTGEYERLAEAASSLGRAIAQADEGFERVPFVMETLRRTIFNELSLRIQGHELRVTKYAVNHLMTNYMGALARGYFTVQHGHLLAKIDRLNEQHALKDEFLSIISHELRTPLTFIVAYGEILGDELFGELNEHERDAVERILEGAHRLDRLVEDLLETSRLGAGKLRIEVEDFDYEPVVRQEFERIRVACKTKGVTIRLDVPDHLPMMRADPTRAAQVLDNLLSNACKFTSAGEIAIIVAYDGERICTTVADTGPGFSEEERAGLFHKFYQVESVRRRKKGGTGLGLYIVHSLVTAMGGTIAVESAPGHGARFRFCLPAVPPVVPPPAETRLDAASPAA